MQYAIIAPGAGDGRVVTISKATGGLEVTEVDAPEELLASARGAGFTAGALLLDLDLLGQGSVDDPVAQLTYAGPSAETLHSDYVGRGRVDELAPTQAAGEIVIEATPECVWAVLAEVESWPTIRADISDVRAEGPAAPGVRFTWQAGANRLTSRFALVEPGQRLTYTSVAAGTRVAHVYELAAKGTGTVLSCRESLAAPILARFLPSAALQAGVDSWLAGVKAVAESANSNNRH
ncbi:SRPBCC family protein [Phytohabitans sp. LJ34]|uniref:SRPBCC family protein n=1 Tax=Phytohabitans sp. LJ34 TaxID=3452217 RepID=UPI003F8A1146